MKTTSAFVLSMALGLAQGQSSAKVNYDRICNGPETATLENGAEVTYHCGKAAPGNQYTSVAASSPEECLNLCVEKGKPECPGIAWTSRPTAPLPCLLAKHNPLPELTTTANVLFATYEVPVEEDPFGGEEDPFGSEDQCKGLDECQKKLKDLEDEQDAFTGGDGSAAKCPNAHGRNVKVNNQEWYVNCKKYYHSGPSVSSPSLKSCIDSCTGNCARVAFNTKSKVCAKATEYYFPNIATGTTGWVHANKA